MMAGASSEGPLAGVTGEQTSAEQLLERIAQLARHFAQADSLDETLQRIVDRAEELLAGCDGVSMMVVSKDGVSSPAYSSRIAYESDLLQYRTGQGPCLGAIAQRETLVIDDLQTEQRWPAYRTEALALGVRGMLSLRLFAVEDTIGALNLYSKRPHVFDRWSVMLGQVFAAHASVAMKSAFTEAGLEHAIATRDIIGQAKGILIERERLTGQQAFDRLRTLSQTRHIKLRDLAADIVATGEIPDLP